MLLALHYNLAHKEVVLTLKVPGSPHARHIVLKDGKNGAPSFDEFFNEHREELLALEESADAIVRYLDAPQRKPSLSEIRGKALPSPAPVPTVAEEPPAEG